MNVYVFQVRASVTLLERQPSGESPKARGNSNLNTCLKSYKYISSELN
jgi:hypothetical protein